MAVAAQSSRQVSRNGFMIAVMSIVGTVIGVFYVGALLRYLYPKSSDTPPLDVTLQPDGVLDPGTGQLIPFVNGVTKEAFYYPTVSDKSVVVGVFVMKNEANGPLDASNLQVVEQTCTHLGCPVAWVPGDNRYECPCHGSQFNRQLKRVAGPAQDPLHTHEFKLNGTKLTILKRKS